MGKRSRRRRNKKNKDKNALFMSLYRLKSGAVCKVVRSYGDQNIKVYLPTGHIISVARHELGEKLKFNAKELQQFEEEWINNRMNLF